MTARLVPLLLAACLGVLTAGTGTAWAHAEVVATYPSSTAATDRMTHVSVTFDEEVDLIPRALVLTTDLGVPVALDAPRLIDGREVRADLQDSVAPGRYAVGWRVRADDGHVESGSFHFRLVGAAAADKAATPGRTTTAVPPMPEPDEPIWPVLVAAGLALAAGLGAAVVVRRGLRSLAAPGPLYPADPINAASRNEHAPSSE
jgi:methionine-rich copper-binding protein CopC